ncbi:hypothetical protein M405DRAFT_938855 [Rhizopogon salebrosus TDB-379]|nr:hypothetical protein M405DRAFT_938855 [Rhizopogon salebrosus TDB-379]
MAPLYYSSRLVVVGVVSHSIAILSTIFRLVYRGWTRRFWYEDAWAAFALIADVLCLACIWVDSSISSWTLAVTFPSVLWAARMSIIFSIIRVTENTVTKVHRKITYLIAVSFACMWTALLVQKLGVCHFHSCHMGKPVAFSQLITDIVADAALVITPLHLWKNVGLSRNRKIMVLSAFSSSLLLTAVTIAHSVTLIRPPTHGTLILAHAKVALSLVICNLLVIVTFAYRVFCSETLDLDQSFASRGLFTNIVMVQYPSGTNVETSNFAQEGSFSSQITTAQFVTTKPKMEDA